MAENSFADDINIADDIELRFGSDDDAAIAWDSAAARLEFRDAGGNVLGFLTDDGTTGSLTLTGNLSAEIVKVTSPTTDYHIGSRSGSTALVVEAQSAGSIPQVELFAKDGDGTDHITFAVYGRGTVTTLGTIFEVGIFRWNSSLGAYTLESLAGGTGTTRNIQQFTGTDTDQLVLRASNGNVGIQSGTTPDAPLEVTGHSTLGQQVITIDQDDTDQPFIDFQGTTGANTTSTISTLTTSGTVTHHLMVEVNGTKAWIPCSTNNPS